MPKPFSTKKLVQVRQGGVDHLLDLKEKNTKPFEAIEEAASKLDSLRPYSTGDPLRDLTGIDRQLNHLPEKLKELNERQLSEAWDEAEKVGRRAVFVQSHIALTINRKYAEEGVKKFAEAKNKSVRTIYNYIKLAELFPKIDPILDPSFYFKAIDMAHGDRDKSVKLIEMAKEKKSDDPAYSVRDFMSESAKKTGKKKEVSTKAVITRVASLLQEIRKAKDVAEYRAELQDIKNLLDGILGPIKRSR